MKTHRIAGTALLLGGLVYLIANSVLTILLPVSEDWTATYASTGFLARLSVAATAVFLLFAGALGLHAAQAHKTGWFGSLAFAVLFAGSMLTFAHEWGQVFFLHPLAVIAPESLRAMEDVEGANLYDIEAMLAMGGFVLGWLLFAISMLMARVFRPLGPLLIIGGLFSISLLTAALPGLWGFVAGNAITALGWIVLGRELQAYRPEQASEAGPVPTSA